ncbi:MAG: ATP phosphoribosyltransferase regulatory subunit [Acidobacteriota bacterium]
MNHQISKIPKGVRYFFGQEVVRRRAIEQSILTVFQGWSYHEIILPIFDYHKLFALGMGAEAAEHTYRFIDPDGELLALRPDLTSLVARTVAARFAEVTRPIRLCYSGEVFRYREAHEQRPHDFHQLGLEHIGNDRLEADVEVLLIAIEVLTALGMTNFKIALGQVNFFNGILAQLGLDVEQGQWLRHLVDSRNIQEIDRFLVDRLAKTERAQLCRLTQLSGKREILKEARTLAINNTCQTALDDLEGILGIAEVLGIDRYIEIDLGDVHGLDYYTGMTFKIYGEGLGSAIGSGGRYDSLLKNFGFDEPAVGFQLSLDWLAQIAPVPDLDTGATQQLLASQDLVKVFRQAQQLRAQGKCVEIGNLTNFPQT